MSRINSLINKIIRPLGIVIKRANELEGRNTMYDAIERSKSFHHVNPVTVIDVGAAKGIWTSMAIKVWPGSNYVLFEPLKEREEILSDIRNKNKNIYIVNKAAGDSNIEIDFFIATDLDGSGVAGDISASNLRKVKQTTLDAEISGLQLKGPFVIKLDTHGYEVPIIDGAEKILKDTQLLIIECYGFKIAPFSLLFWEMCAYLKSKGFRLIDIVDIDLRKKDGAFWQCDAFFIPDTSPCFSSNSYL